MPKDETQEERRLRIFEVSFGHENAMYVFAYTPADAVRYAEANQYNGVYRRMTEETKKALLVEMEKYGGVVKELVPVEGGGFGFYY